MPTHDYQQRVDRWLLDCFGKETAADRMERSHRFLEEALELAQAAGCTRADVSTLADYVFDRPKGDLNQEVGGTMVTLAALCTAWDVDMRQCGEDELERVWTRIAEIRAKQAKKPKSSPLPQ